MSITEDRRSDFCSWLLRTSKSGKVSRVEAYIDELSQYCIEKHFSKQRLFNIDDASTTRKLCSTLQGDRLFRFNNRGECEELLKALRLYTAFLEECPKGLNQTVAPVTSSPNTSLQECEIDEEGQERESAKESIVIDGPVDHEHFDAWLKANTSTIVRSYVLALIDKANQYAASKGLNEAMLYGVHSREDAKAALDRLLTQKRWEQESTESVNELRQRAEKYYIPFVNAMIGHVDTDASRKSAPRTTKPSDLGKALYESWLRKQGYSEKIIANMVAAVEKAEAFAKKRGLGGEALFETAELSVATSTLNALLTDHRFVEADKKIKGFYVQSISKYLDILRKKPVVTDLTKPETSVESPIEDRKTQDNLAAPPVQDVVYLLDQARLPYVDRRPYGGKLWLKGGMQHADFILRAKKLDFEFKYVPDGTSLGMAGQCWYLVDGSAPKTVEASKKAHKSVEMPESSVLTQLQPDIHRIPELKAASAVPEPSRTSEKPLVALQKAVTDESALKTVEVSKIVSKSVEVLESSTTTQHQIDMHKVPERKAESVMPETSRANEKPMVALQKTNLSRTNDFAFCAIEYIQIEDDRLDAPRSWKVAYQWGMNWLLHHRKDAFLREEYRWYFNGSATLSTCKLDNGTVICTNYSSTDLMKRLASACTVCGVSLERAVVGYTGFRSKATEDKLQLQVSSKEEVPLPDTSVLNTNISTGKPLPVKAIANTSVTARPVRIVPDGKHALARV